MKIFIKVLIVIVLIAAVLLIAKNQIVKTAVSAGVKAATGLDARMGRADVGILKTRIGFYDFVVSNPAKYSDRVFVTLPEIYVDYHLGDILKKDIHLEDVRINLSELVIIKNADGSMNIQELKAPPESSGPQPKVRIDNFSLKLGKVIYKDYSRGKEPMVKEYALNVDEKFQNMTGAQDLVPLLTGKVMLIVQKILINSSISDISNIGGALKGEMGDLIGSAADLGKGIASKDSLEKVTGSVDAAKDKLKGLFK